MQRFASSFFSYKELEAVPLSSQAMYAFLFLLFFPYFFLWALTLCDWFRHSIFISPCLPQSKQVKLGELWTFFVYLFYGWPLSFPILFRNLLNFLVSSVKVSVSSLLSSFWTANLSVIPFCFLSPCSCSFSLFISSSCFLSFPNNVALVKVVKSLVSEMVVTFSC